MTRKLDKMTEAYDYFSLSVTGGQCELCDPWQEGVQVDHRLHVFKRHGKTQPLLTVPCYKTLHHVLHRNSLGWKREHFKKSSFLSKIKQKQANKVSKYWLFKKANY